MTENKLKSLTLFVKRLFKWFNPNTFCELVQRFHVLLHTFSFRENITFKFSAHFLYCNEICVHRTRKVRRVPAWCIGRGPYARINCHSSRALCSRRAHAYPGRETLNIYTLKSILTSIVRAQNRFGTAATFCGTLLLISANTRQEAAIVVPMVDVHTAYMFALYICVSVHKLVVCGSPSAPKPSASPSSSTPPRALV